MRNSRTEWNANSVVEGVSAFLKAQRRANLCKELEAELDISPSTAEKLIGGRLASISGHLLMNLDAHFGGELLRSLRGLPDDVKSNRMLQLIKEMKEIALS